MTAPHQNTGFIRLTILCAITYFVSYISRINLSASVVELVASGFISKEMIALALSANALTYATGQIISGYLGDRFKPQNVMSFGFFLACAMNIGVAVTPSSQWILPLWAINGFAQALIWPPMVHILSMHLNSTQYTLACKWVSWGSAAATITIYTCVPLLIKAFDFRAIFWIGGAAAFVIAIGGKALYERYFSHNVSTERMTETVAPPSRRFDATAICPLVMILIVIVVHGALRDGAATWLPTIVSESFGLDSSSAILTGVLLPVFHMLFTQLASMIYTRYFRNEMTCTCVIFSGATIASGLLVLIGTRYVFPSVLLIASLVGCMHGANFILTCMVPPQFKRYGHVSLVSGIINSSTYVGSAVSTYGIALLSERFGWTITLRFWFAFAAAGVCITVLLIRKWRAFTR